jgi:hypothetical protein
MYTLGDLASADELWSLDAGDKAAWCICGPRLQSLLYPAERRLPR